MKMKSLLDEQEMARRNNGARVETWMDILLTAPGGHNTKFQLSSWKLSYFSPFRRLWGVMGGGDVEILTPMETLITKQGRLHASISHARVDRGSDGV